MALNQQVKDLIQKLGEAIHESVSESDPIANVVREIREQGFDVMLMLEATIGLNRLESEAEDAEEDAAATEAVGGGPFTRHDLTFLRSLRITTEENEAGTPDAPDALPGPSPEGSAHPASPANPAPANPAPANPERPDRRKPSPPGA